MGAISGLSCFGTEYRALFENDPHAAGSVDRVLMSRMVLLNEESRERLYGPSAQLATRLTSDYLRGARPELEAVLSRISRSLTLIEGIAGFCRGLARSVLPHSIEEMRFGGTEEDLIVRGTDWCTDLARVACVLYQVAGLPSRLVYLADTSRANHGHVAVEVHDGAAWGVVNQNDGHVFRGEDGTRLSAWLLQSDRSRVEKSIPPGYFNAVAISDYSVADREKYEYPVSGINDYYRRILSPKIIN